MAMFSIPFILNYKPFLKINVGCFLELLSLIDIIKNKLLY